MKRSEVLLVSGAAVGLAAYYLAPSPGLALIGALAYFYMCLKDPRPGLLLVVASLPLYLHPRGLGGSAFSLTEMALVLAASATFIRLVWARWCEREDHLLQPGPTSFDWPIALFLASALLSVGISEYLKLSLRELRTLVLEPVAFYYLAVWLAPGPASPRPLVHAFLLGAVGSALLALGQYALNIWTVEVEGVRRAMGPYLSPNHLALYLGRALPFLAALAWLDKTHRLVYLGAMVPVGVALALTFSVGGWAGTLAGLLVVTAGAGGLRAVATAAGGAGALALAALPALRVERVISHLDPTQGTTFFRLQIWQSAWQMVRDHPVLGIGLDNFLYLYRQRYMLPEAWAEPNISHPHNFLLHFWLQTGLPGLAAMAWLLAIFFRRAHQVFRGDSPFWARALALGATGSMVDFLVHGLIDNSYFLVDLAFVFWMTLAMMEALRPRPRDRGAMARDV